MSRWYDFNLDGTPVELPDKARAGRITLEFGDYSRLPKAGIWHFSVPDAALVCALEMWAAGAVPSVGGQAFDDSGAPAEEQRKRAAAELAPLRASIAAAMLRSI